MDTDDDYLSDDAHLVLSLRINKENEDHSNYSLANKRRKSITGRQPSPAKSTTSMVRPSKKSKIKPKRRKRARSVSPLPSKLDPNVYSSTKSRPHGLI